MFTVVQKSYSGDIMMLKVFSSASPITKLFIFPVTEQKAVEIRPCYFVKQHFSQNGPNLQHIKGRLETLYVSRTD